MRETTTRRRGARADTVGVLPHHEVPGSCGLREWRVLHLQDDGPHEVLQADLAVAIEVGLSDHLLALHRAGR
eukprot:scaffold13913_cov64-Phaeocystis_antarctica.AAC.1